MGDCHRPDGRCCSVLGRVQRIGAEHNHYPVRPNDSNPPDQRRCAADAHGVPGTVQFSFTNNPNAQFTVLSATDLTLPIAQWTVVGTATNLSAGVYQFTDPQATNPARYYRVRSP